MCSSPTSQKLHNEVTVAISISAAMILVQCIGRHNASFTSDSTSFPLYCFYFWWSDRTIKCTCLMVQLSTTQLMLQPCMAILIHGHWHQWKDWPQISLPHAAWTEGSVGLHQKLSQSLVKQILYYPSLGKSISPTLKPSILYCLLRCKSSGMCEYNGRWKVVLLLRLNSLLYKRHYTAFISVKNCSDFIHFCTELLTLLHSILYSLVTLHSCYVQNFLHCMHACTEFLILYSQTSVYERLGSWTIRFMNKFSEHKASRMMYCVLSYEHASHQHRGKKDRKKKKNPLPNNNISLPHHLPLTPSALLHTGKLKLN